MKKRFHGSVREALLTSKTRTPAGRPDSANALGYVWLRVRAEVFGGFQSQLTKKQYGQLRYIIDRSPPGKAPEIVEYVVRNWIEFVKDVETKAGAFGTPSEPSLDFLLKHIEIAANLWLSTQKPAVKEQPVVSHAPIVQSIAQDDDDKPIESLEELLALINGDET